MESSDLVSSSCADVNIIPQLKSSEEECSGASKSGPCLAEKFDEKSNLGTETEIASARHSNSTKQSENDKLLKLFSTTGAPLLPPPCYEGKCLNGGVCDGRKCKCRSGTSGQRCEIEGG